MTPEIDIDVYVIPVKGNPWYHCQYEYEGRRYWPCDFGMPLEMILYVPVHHRPDRISNEEVYRRIRERDEYIERGKLFHVALYRTFVAAIPQKFLGDVFDGLFVAAAYLLGIIALTSPVWIWVAFMGWLSQG